MLSHRSPALADATAIALESGTGDVLECIADTPGLSSNFRLQAVLFRDSEEPVFGGSMARTLALAIIGMVLATAIRCGAQSDAAANDAADGKPVDAMQQQIIARPELMEAVSELQADPAFQKALDDPDVAAALESGNIEALLTNPKILGLANHPKVQEITKKLGQ